MELMDTSLDKFYKQVHEKGMTIPEDILGKTAVSVSILHKNCLYIVLVITHIHRSSLCQEKLKSLNFQLPCKSIYLNAALGRPFLGSNAN